MRLLITLVVLSCAVASPQAQTFVKQDATGNADGTSWEDAFTDLQVALEHSMAGDELWISSGTYTPNGPTPDSSHFVVDKAIGIFGGFSGIESALEERDWEANPTILSGDINGDDTEGDFDMHREDNAQHIVMIQALGGMPLMDGLILTGGTTRIDDIDFQNPSPWEGGAMFVTSELTLRNCTFRDNNGYRGAALDASFPDSTINNLILENCLFESNSSVQGGVRLVNLLNPIIRGCTFLNNQSTVFGSALVLGNSNMTIANCLFEMNRSGNWGGAIAIFQNSTTGIDQPLVRISTSVFKTNSAFSFGGAVAFQNFSSATEFIIDSCEFVGNAGINPTTGQGGAIRVLNQPESSETSPSISININETEFIENTGRFGAGLLCWSDANAMTIDLSKSNFLRNESISGGAGLYVFNRFTAEVNVRLKRVEFDGNIGEAGGGINFYNLDNENKMQFAIDSCEFKNNVANNYGGAIASNGSIGSIFNSDFKDNIGIASSGALDSGGDSLLIGNCLFSGNFTEGVFAGYEGGAGMLVWRAGDVNVTNTVYSENTSLAEGAAIFNADDSKVRFENVLFNNNTGISTILNAGNLNLVNVTMIDNEVGIFQLNNTYTEFQNTILNNDVINFIGAGNQSLASKGGNIRNDDSMIDLLKGYGGFEDLHETTARLDTNFVPMEDSPCVDKGNPEGMSSDYDLAGKDRVQGNRIDIGSYESPFTSAVRDIAWNSPELIVFPNPVQKNLQFQIEDDWTGDLNVSIYDLLGRKVHASKRSKASGEQLFRENVSHLTSGEYILLVSSANDTYATKIIVQN